MIEYTAEMDMAGDTDAVWAAAEQRFRTLTYDPEQKFTADALHHLPPDAVHAKQSDDGPWHGAQAVPLDALRPVGVSSLYVLGACADLAGVRPSHPSATLPQAARALPLLGRYDVVVVGGGTCGAPADSASARQGAKTLVIEQHHGLGGLGTLGSVAFYFWGNRCGFNNTTPAPDSTWIIEQKMQWWREEFLKAGGELWFGCTGCGAFVQNGRVCGVIVATPRGRGLVLAKAVVDTTGNADIAAAAGAECLYTDHRDFALMGAGVPPRNLGANHGGADFCIVDETDLVDVWHLSVYAKDKHLHAFDQGPIIDSRERRRIVGDHTLTILDELNERTYPDTIAVAHSPFDLGIRPLLSPLDRFVIILGRAGDRRAVPLIVEKLQRLTADDDFSHHRAVALALEALADPAAAKPLAALLAKPGMSGHAYTSIEVAREREKPGGDYNVVKNRRESLRELILARALYRCGDCEGFGEKTLRRYAEDLRGHLSRHARAVLTTW